MLTSAVGLSPTAANQDSDQNASAADAPLPPDLTEVQGQYVIQHYTNETFCFLKMYLLRCTILTGLIFFRSCRPGVSSFGGDS